MKVYRIFFSPTGGTKKAAEALTDTWDGDLIDIDLIKARDQLRTIEFSADDVVFAAVPSFGGRIPSVIYGLLEGVSGNQARTVLTAVYGNRAYEDTLIELKNALENAGFCCIVAVACNAEHSIMHQYGVGRPDAQDIRELREFSAKIKSSIENGTYSSSLRIPGNFPYREYGGVPMKPKARKSCTDCGICAAECPADAIPADKPSFTDKEKCISCMHCISVCPVQARSLNKMMVNAGAAAMKKLFAERKGNELFL